MSGNRSFTTPTIGEIDVQTPANPGAGNNLSFTIPANFIYLIQGISFTFTTDVTVITRQVRLAYLTSGTDKLGSVRDYDSQLASLVIDYFGNFGVRQDPTDTEPKMLALPVLFLEAGDIFGSAIDNFQAADAITNLVISSRRWRT